ncbi:hypothetical protein RI129_002378 [Pyrocoelia pectoralis]|uniref:Thioredoxin-like fold domain-containing protein n=1 Tax=Pyrocoelia pectoralis TaxID=417401 RepID=A0AAN7VLD2_9COLE
MDSIQGVELIKADGGVRQANTVIQNNRYIMYYFSAVWCLGCKFILPKITEIYESRKRQIPLEIIYVSFDNNKEEMMQCFKDNHGDWLAIPFGSSTIQELKVRYGVTYVPFIVVLRNDGTIITTNGKKEVEDLGINVLVTWTD